MFSAFVCTKLFPTFNYLLGIAYTELHNDHAQVPKTQRRRKQLCSEVSLTAIKQPAQP
jgi:hypothetical protein